MRNLLENRMRHLENADADNDANDDADGIPQAEMCFDRAGSFGVGIHAAFSRGVRGIVPFPHRLLHGNRDMAVSASAKCAGAGFGPAYQEKTITDRTDDTDEKTVAGHVFAVIYSKARCRLTLRQKGANA